MLTFSILLPVHNGANFIGETITSILAQDYPYFELLILENGSTDRTLDIIGQFHDGRIRVIPAPKFLSIEENWARMIDLKLNEFMTIFCHDDPLKPGYLSEMVRLISAEPSASIYHSHFNLIDEQNYVIRKSRSVGYKETVEQSLDRIHAFEEDIPGSGYTMRSKDFIAVGGFPNLPGLLFSDALCWARIANLSHKVCSAQYLYSFRIHPSSSGRQSRLDSFYEAGKTYLEALKNIPHHHEVAIIFIKKFIKQRTHLWLFDIMESSTLNRFDRYNKVKAELTKRAQVDNFINLFPWTVTLHEIIAKIPFLPIRKLIVKLMQVALVLRGMMVTALRK